LGFRPGAKGVAGGIGLLQRRGVLNLLQQILRVAVEVIAGVAANDLGCGFERTNRLVGMRDKVDRRMNRVLRPARQTVPPAKVPTLPWVTEENLALP
jgi:hypothetical protein